MKITIIFITLFFIFGCSRGKKKEQEKVLVKSKTTSETTKIFPKKNYPSYRFQDYEVKRTNFIKAKTLDKISFEKFKNFKTRINYGFKQAPNFANYYIVVSWGCGSSCQSGVIINAESGKIIGLPTSSFGLEYKKDSRLLIVDPFLDEEKTHGRYKEYGAPSYYVLQNNELKRLKVK